MRHSFRYAFPALAMLTAVAAPPPVNAADASRWSTDFGPLDLVINGDKARGTYSQYQGTFQGRYDAARRVVSGVWMQPRSEVRCDKPRGGTAYWGKVTWTLNANGSLRGQWSYCDAKPGTHGAWNGTLTGGSVPMAAAARGGDGRTYSVGAGEPDGRKPAAVAPPARAPAPAPAPVPAAGGGMPDDGEIYQEARTWFGSEADPSGMRRADGDVTCDGRPDVVLGRMNIDSPEGVSFDILVVAKGADGKVESAFHYLPYDDSEFALCDTSRDPEVTVATLEPGEVPAFTAEAVCRTAISVYDRQCVPITLFWRTQPKEGQDRLLPAIN